LSPLGFFFCLFFLVFFSFSSFFFFSVVAWISFPPFRVARAVSLPSTPTACHYSLSCFQFCEFIFPLMGASLSPPARRLPLALVNRRRFTLLSRFVFPCPAVASFTVPCLFAGLDLSITHGLYLGWYAGFCALSFACGEKPYPPLRLTSFLSESFVVRTYFSGSSRRIFPSLLGPFRLSPLRSYRVILHPSWASAGSQARLASYQIFMRMFHLYSYVSKVFDCLHSFRVTRDSR